MGRKADTETLSVLLLAFLEERTWKQKDLQRRCDVDRKTLTKLLTGLQHAGLPLQCEEDPPHVYWSVPKTWFPAAVAFQSSDVEELAQLLQRAPKSKRSQRLLSKIAASAAGIRTLPQTDDPAAPAPPVRCVFRVRSPEASLTKSRLTIPFETEELKDETKFTVVTTDLIPLARFIVGLGATAAVETAELRQWVKELAEGALKNVKRHRAVTAMVGDDNAFAGE